MKNLKFPTLTLAIAPTGRGFAFAVLEGPQTPFDWGSKFIKRPGKNAAILKSVQEIIERCHPAALIIQDVSHQSAGRPARTKALALSLKHLAGALQISFYQYDRAAIRRTFAPVGARTKYEIARSIAVQIPAFSDKLFPLRKTWMSEDHRQALFDAIALVLTHYKETSDNPNPAS